MSWEKIVTIHGGSRKHYYQVCQLLICCLLAPNSPFFSLPCYTEQSQDPANSTSLLQAGQQGPLVGMERLEETICVLVWHAFLPFSPQQLGGRHFQWIILQHKAGSMFRAIPLCFHASSLLTLSSLDPQGGCCFLLSCFRVISLPSFFLSFLPLLVVNQSLWR